MSEYRELTKVAMAHIQSTDIWADEIFNDTEYAMDLDRRNVILEGVQNRLKTLGAHYSDSDIGSIVKEINNRYKAIGISEGMPKAVSNWIKESIPANPAYRENLYNLCLALGMSLQETEEFFLKYYMTIPFNYKDRIDAVYYYGLKQGKTYAEIKHILQIIESWSDEESKTDKETYMVQMDLSEIEEDDKLIEYLKDHAFAKEKQFQTARVEIERLVGLNAAVAEKESAKRETLDDERKHHKIMGDDDRANTNELLRVIYGFDHQSYYNGENKGLKRMSKCETLPERFRKRFPRNQEFSDIKNGTASPEVYRKALVILKFYNYFGERILSCLKESKSIYDYQQRDLEECQDDFEEFIQECNACLAKCGFVALYPRNPFDWLILYCAHSSDPLDCFRGLLAERYSLTEE